MSKKLDTVGTISGGRFNFMEPRVEDVLFVDIVYSLARLPRWNAQSKQIITVAQHSVLVARMLRNAGYPTYVQLQGLLHDAAEAYLGDIAAPVKQHLPEFRAMEILVEDVIFQALGVPYPLDPAVKMMDRECCRWEYRDLMAGEGAVGAPVGNRPHLTVWDSERAEYEFFDEFTKMQEHQVFVTQSLGEVTT